MDSKSVRVKSVTISPLMFFTGLLTTEGIGVRGIFIFCTLRALGVIPYWRLKARVNDDWAPKLSRYEISVRDN
ncbi:hypothetical protein D3C76_1471150 [compost metagenome]